jgi:hypothetical protein
MAPQANAPLPSMTMDPQSGMPSRNLIAEDIVARTGIDEVMIDRLVRTFYARARLYESVSARYSGRCPWLGCGGRTRFRWYRQLCSWRAVRNNQRAHAQAVLSADYA